MQLWRRLTATGPERVRGNIADHSSVLLRRATALVIIRPW
jgi:hypothetical protein